MSLLHSVLRQAHGLRTTPSRALLHPHWQLRRASSAAAQQARHKAALYPRTINIFRAGTPATLGVGVMRLSSLVLFVVGAGFYAPVFYFSPDHSNWYAPAFVVAAAVPAVVVALATGPMIHGIRVTLPDRVRRGGKDGLRRWSSMNTPGDTHLELQYMRWKPWPQKKVVPLRELTRLRPTLARGIANMEWTPARAGDEAWARQRKEHPWYASLAARSMSRFYVKRDQKTDRAAVPGVWDGIWAQIPMEGDEPGVKRAPPPLRAVVPPQAAIGRP